MTTREKAGKDQAETKSQGAEEGRPGKMAPPRFSVLVSEIKAAMIFASNDDARYVLTGVHFEGRKKKPPVIVTTDGRRLVVIETEALQEEGARFAGVDFTVRADFLKPLIAFARTQAATLTIEPHLPERVVFEMREAHCVVDVEKGALVEGNFPDWRKVVPSGEKQRVEQLGLNAKFVGDFAAAARALGSEQPCIQMNIFSKDAAVEVNIAGKPNFYGVIMPTRHEEKEEWQPEFLGMEAYMKPAPFKDEDPDKEAA